MTISIATADWLRKPATQKIMALLSSVDGIDPPRFVGGCVRNTLMQRTVDDIDIATPMRPEAVMNCLQAGGIKTLPTGIEHGTVTAIIAYEPFEITTLRRDVETDGRRAVVAFTQDWQEDAQRRDFRLNAIYADQHGTLYDPTGKGISDALAGQVIFIGAGEDRLREDYLRILRFFRFNAWYGQAIDPAGLSACRALKDGLRKIARERIGKELKKLLSAPQPFISLEAMAQTGVLNVILPEAQPSDMLHNLHLNEILTGQAPDPMRRLMALIAKTQQASEQTASALRLSRAEETRLSHWAKLDLLDIKQLSGRTLRVFLYRHGAKAVMDNALLSSTDARDIVAACQSWHRPVFPVTGADLQSAGIAPGPELGKTLARLEEHWIASDFRAEKRELLNQLM